MEANNNKSTPRQRLASVMESAILAVGQAVSTDTGKMLFALAYDNACMYELEQERIARFEGKRPTKASQEANHYAGIDLGRRWAYVDALSSMASEMSGRKASVYRCRLVINGEISAMQERTDKQQIAAPITSLYSKAIDW